MKKIIATSAIAIMLTGAGAAQASDGGHLLGTLIGAAGGAAVGSNVGKGKGNIVAVAVGTLIGAGMGGSVGRSVDRNNTYYRTTTYTTTYPNMAGYGQTDYVIPNYQHVSYKPKKWEHKHRKNRNNHHDYKPVSYKVNQPYCREFLQTITIGGQQQSSYGTACQQPDGVWKIQN